MELKNFFAQDELGNILHDATCYLYERGTESLVPLLRAANGSALSNPFTTDSNGLVQFAAPNGYYDLRVVTGARDHRLVVQCNDVNDTLKSAESAAKRAEVARDVAQLTSGTYDTTAIGLQKTADGAYFNVPSADTAESLILYQRVGSQAVARKSYPSADAVAALDSLKVNSGKAYPLKSMIRAGATTPAQTYWNNAILHVRVTGAQPGEYYQLAYQQNEAVISNASKFNWIIKKFDAATFSTTAAGEQELVGLSDTVPQIVRSAGVQTLIIVPPSRPDMSFIITLDSLKLPPTGVPINSNSAGSDGGRSWIIDPSCYHFTPRAPDDTLRQNAGKVLPLNSVVPRKLVTSADSAPLRNLLLDAAVFGAEEGKYYRIAYISATGTGDAVTLGFILEEFDAATYETDGTALRLHHYTTPGPVVKRSGGVQTVMVATTVKPSVRFRITLDGAMVPAANAAIAAVNTGFAGWSWIVDPSRYYLAERTTTVKAQESGVYYEYNPTTGRVSYAYLSGRYYYRVTFGYNGTNQLPNLIGVDRAPAGGSIETATWVNLTTTDTDYFPPMIFQAMNNGDPAAVKNYTGGAHGANADGTGAPTARSSVFKVYADGKLLNGISAGYAQRVQALVVNELMAWNTISLGRYPGRQSFGVDMSAHGMELHLEFFAREALQVSMDNGPQVYFGGFNDSQLMLGGQTPERAPLNTSVSSGAKSDYPNAWAIVMKSASNGLLMSWMDRSYEAGDGRYVGDGMPFIRGPGANRAKFYHAAVSGFTAALAAGQSYKWRGGFHFCDDLPAEGYDCQVSITMGKVPNLVSVLPDGSSIVV